MHLVSISRYFITYYIPKNMGMDTSFSSLILKVKNAVYPPYTRADMAATIFPIKDPHPSLKSDMLTTTVPAILFQVNTIL